MTDLPAADLPALARSLNAVDLVLLVVGAFYAVDGIRRGFVASALGLVGVAATILLAIKGYRPAADLLRQHTTLPALLANVAGFFALLVAASLAWAMLARLVLAAFRPVRRRLGPLRLVDHAVGIIPGLVQATALAALVLTPLHLFPLYRPLTEAIDDSVLAGEITRRAAGLTPRLEAVIGEALGEGLVFRTRPVAPDGRLQIPPQTELRPDPEAEARMLALVNAERAGSGLRPLVADERIRDVARLHSEEMFRQGYFSHTSSQTGSPADRLRQGGVRFALAGENLAYAPTVDVAHAGLMESPGHRRNILMPEYSRIGIGVISAGLHGRMFTQNFVD